MAVDFHFAIVGIMLWEMLQSTGYATLSLPLFVVLSLLIGAVPAGLLSQWVFRWVKSGAASSPRRHQ